MIEFEFESEFGCSQADALQDFPTTTAGMPRIPTSSNTNFGRTVYSNLVALGAFRSLSYVDNSSCYCKHHSRRTCRSSVLFLAPSSIAFAVTLVTLGVDQDRHYEVGALPWEICSAALPKVCKTVRPSASRPQNSEVGYDESPTPQTNLSATTQINRHSISNNGENWCKTYKRTSGQPAKRLSTKPAECRRPPGHGRNGLKRALKGTR